MPTGVARRVPVEQRGHRQVVHRDYLNPAIGPVLFAETSIGRNGNNATAAARKSLGQDQQRKGKAVEVVSTSGSPRKIMFGMTATVTNMMTLGA